MYMKNMSKRILGSYGRLFAEKIQYRQKNTRYCYVLKYEKELTQLINLFLQATACDKNVVLCLAQKVTHDVSIK